MYTATEPDVLTRLTHLLNKMEPEMKKHVCVLGENDETLFERANIYRTVYTKESSAGRSGALEPYTKERIKQEEERLGNKLMQEWQDKESLLLAGRGQEPKTEGFVYPLQDLSPQLAWERLSAHPSLSESSTYQDYAALYAHEVINDVAPNLERLDIRIGGGMTPSVIVGSKDAYWALGRRNRLVINTPTTTWQGSSLTKKPPISSGELSLIESRVSEALLQFHTIKQAKATKQGLLSKFFRDSCTETTDYANRLLDDLEWTLTQLYTQVTIEHERLSQYRPVLEKDYKRLLIEDCRTLSRHLEALGWHLVMEDL